jgi:hypothetical protein
VVTAVVAFGSQHLGGVVLAVAPGGMFSGLATGFAPLSKSRLRTA